MMVQKYICAVDLKRNDHQVRVCSYIYVYTQSNWHTICIMVFEYKFKLIDTFFLILYYLWLKGIMFLVIL